MDQVELGAVLTSRWSRPRSQCYAMSSSVVNSFQWTFGTRVGALGACADLRTVVPFCCLCAFLLTNQGISRPTLALASPPLPFPLHVPGTYVTVPAARPDDAEHRVNGAKTALGTLRSFRLQKLKRQSRYRITRQTTPPSSYPSSHSRTITIYRPPTLTSNRWALSPFPNPFPSLSFIYSMLFCIASWDIWLIHFSWNVPDRDKLCEKTCAQLCLNQFI